ncbi:hypothetical protein B2J93_6225 [Marssonina coronariae]|uniref:FAD-binding domain-containing protein n=1 Tax=Diplocarpon coronariae TaxID=2795749 RepID=A0A218ZCW5_9HELO|nr:hypothetical protein B2J93_6225 [Marssonina coronariae]
MDVDIAMVGGGPAGLALAGNLERASFSSVVYQPSARDVPPRGGCLDLHEGGGQLAMEEAGCYEKCWECGQEVEMQPFTKPVVPTSDDRTSRRREAGFSLLLRRFTHTG